MAASCEDDMVAPTSFEETFATPAALQTAARAVPSAAIEKDGTYWREIAREALRRLTLSELMRLALGAAIGKYRESLSLQQADEPNTAESAMVLDIPVMTVRSRLR